MPTPSPEREEGAGPVGIVLAGGASRRFGSDKARFEIVSGESGETLAGRAVRRLAAVCREVAVADAERGVVPGARSIPDGPGRGPAAGLLGAARAFPARALLVLACDLPAVPSALLARLAEMGAAGGGADLVLPRWGGSVEPLAALYGPKALAALARRVAEGRYALHALADEPGLAMVTLGGAALSSFGPPEEIFANLNTPADFARWSTTLGVR